MSAHRLLPVLTALALLSGVANADVAVIVNPANQLAIVNPSQISDLYLGRSRTFKNGTPATVLETSENNQRMVFYRSLNGMTMSQLNAYWARLKFSGEIQPPPLLPDSRAVLNAVRKNTNAIGYVDAALVDKSVRVVLMLSDDN